MTEKTKKKASHNYDGNLIDKVVDPKDKSRLGALIGCAYAGWGGDVAEFDTLNLGPKLESAAYSLLYGLKQAVLRASGIADKTGNSTVNAFNRALAKIANGESLDDELKFKITDIGYAGIIGWQATLDSTNLDSITPEEGYQGMIDLANHVLTVNGITADVVLRTTR